ncbi:GxxExxY protein [Niabella drilacis]|uniref:GxxExxY protein n=2 Tax=Niabella drilacis (strain DSM 25811 / CCM 8410 / CCUG 62505 / LMG 26954 / E90) TaxID=1285928 RepID=A0A1G6NQ12_NIADE|nr:GxxExxY protein [Niabella drilacis]
MKVHSVLGPGFLESVYCEALTKEFERQHIPFEKEKKLNVLYEGILLDKTFRVDFFCYNEIMVEIKAVGFLLPITELQILNYIKAANKKLGILVNFGEASLRYRRVLNSMHS